MDYLLEARDGVPAYPLGGAVGRHELRVLPFELDQPLHEPVKFEIADLGCIFEVVLSVVVLDLPAQFFNLSGDGPYAHRFLVRTKASIIYQVLSPEFPRTLKLEGILARAADRHMQGDATQAKGDGAGCQMPHSLPNQSLLGKGGV